MTWRKDLKLSKSAMNQKMTEYLNFWAENTNESKLKNIKFEPLGFKMTGVYGQEMNLCLVVKKNIFQFDNIVSNLHFLSEIQS